MMKKIYILLVLTLIIQPFLVPSFGQDSLIINEIMAVNNGFFIDEDGDYSDWIELKNLGSSPVNLKGWYLSDEQFLAKWAFPDTTIEGNSFLIVRASGEDNDTTKLHTNFKLSGSGEMLSLIKEENSIFTSVFSFTFPEQFKNISYGLIDGEFTYINDPTPGAENTTGNFVAPPVFSVPHGQYFAPIQLEITCPTQGAILYFTTDASTPSKTNGKLYTGGLTIDSTIVIRAIAYVGEKQSWTVTQTYIFPEDVIRQPHNPAGYPEQWLRPDGGTDNHYYDDAEYGMTQGVVDHADFSKVIIPAITELPVVSIVTDRDNLFSESMHPDSGGIYMYTGASIGSTSSLLYHTGRGWERPASIEYFNGENDEVDFQANCAIQLHGGASRTRSKNNKHSFRVGFKSDYGPSKLKYKVFGKGSPDQYDWLVLRGGFAHRYGLQIKDPFSKSTMRDMGQYSAYSQFVHVYLNGMYWGMYNLCERMEENTVSEHFGGNEDDYDIIKDYYEIGAGDTVAWKKLMAMTREDMDIEENYQKILGNNADGTRNPGYEIMLDAENFIDYYLCNIYIGNTDWDHHNWLAARRKTNSEGFKFMVWDCEYVLRSTSTNSLEIFHYNRPTEIFYNLIENQTFKNHFVERINNHFFGNGALTPARGHNRYAKWLAVIDTPIVAESARWSFDNFNETDIWESGYHTFINTYFPVRTEIVLNQLIRAGYYPDVAPPVFNTTSKVLPADFGLTMSAPDGGQVYYTIDGEDPAYIKNLEKSEVVMYDGNNIVFPKDTIRIKARVKIDTIWSPLTEKQFILDEPNSVIHHFAENGEFNLFTYPNPANEICNIEFTLPETAEIEISIFDMMGKKIGTLQNGQLFGGLHTIQWQANGVANGVYFCMFTNKNDNSVHRVKIVKN